MLGGVIERALTGQMPYRGSPAGGGYTTVEDLWRFAVALTGLRPLDARHTTMVTSGHRR